MCSDPTVDPYKSCTIILDANICMNRHLSCTHIICNESNDACMSSKVQKFEHLFDRDVSNIWKQELFVELRNGATEKDYLNILTLSIAITLSIWLTFANFHKKTFDQT